jgi:alpha-mannosidase
MLLSNKKNSEWIFASKPTRMLLVSLMEIIAVYGEKEETNGEKGKREK